MDDELVIRLPGPDVEALYRSQVTPAMNERIVIAIRDAYRAAPEIAKSMFKPDQAHEVSPRLRRASLESTLLDLSQFPGVKTESLKSSGSSYYVEIEIGDITLIAARALAPNKMIPKATYRAKIALQSAQRSLFDDAPIEPGARFYAVVLHGGTRGSVDPTFIQVRFPTRDHETYLDARIDLKAEFAHLFEPLVETPVEHIADTTVLTLRRELGAGSSDTDT